MGHDASVEAGVMAEHATAAVTTPPAALMLQTPLPPHMPTAPAGSTGRTHRQADVCAAESSWEPERYRWLPQQVWYSVPVVPAEQCSVAGSML